jgi:hypothetical protein
MKLGRWLLVGVAALAAVAAAVAVGWYVSSQTAVIPDVSQPADLMLAARPGDGWLLLGSVTGVSFRVIGEIDGEAEVWFGEGSPQRVVGRVDLQFGGDWFQRSCSFHYRPKKVTKGKLLVRYEFH